MAVLQAGAPGKRSVVVALLVTLAAPLAAYAAVRNAALDAVGGAGDPTATLPPRSVVPPLRAVMRASRRPEEPLPKNALPVALQAAAAVPLAYEPYYIAARVEEKAGRYRRATVLMEEARRRRPNATSIRVALLGYYSLAYAYQKAIDEADQAMRINARSTSLILPAFAKLVAADAKARQAIAVALAKSPPWGPEFLNVAATAKMAPEDAKALVADVRRLRPSAKPGAEEAFLVRSLVGAGRFREARALWASYGGASAGLVFDPNFQGTPGMQPFAWTFLSGADGTAEVGRPGAGGRSFLEVDYFGDSETVLAEQTLALPPGSYRLSSLVSGNSSAPDVRLAWRLSCLPSKRAAGELQLQPLAERPARREATIAVPGGGCEGQRLALVGQPADLPRTLSAQVSEVSLTPARAARSGR